MLSADDVRQLERLALRGSAVSLSTALSGLRVARARGFGIEFQDFRAYQPGDDPRSIDWTIDARIRQLVVRVFRAEGHLRLHLLVDASASMAAGTPDKFSCATKIAEALAFVALTRKNAVSFATFAGGVRSRVELASGRGQLLRVFDAIRRERPSGQSDIRESLAHVGATLKGPGAVVVISDFYQPGGCLESLRFLIHQGLYPAVVQVVSDDELDPVIDGPVELADIEDPEGAHLHVDAADLDAYQRRMSDLRNELQQFCLDHGLPWFRIAASAPFSQVLQSCARAGLLAVRG